MKTANPKALRPAVRPTNLQAARIRALRGSSLARLRDRLLRRFLAETDNPVLKAGLRRAAAEAESLAWLTPAPQLVLPLLFEEKARQARLYANRQAELREASREWLALAE